jgi:hypothetical protein
MTIGNALMNQNIALFTREETEEALTLLRYFLHKEKSPPGRRDYVGFIRLLEKRLADYSAGQQAGKLQVPGIN